MELGVEFRRYQGVWKEDIRIGILYNCICVKSTDLLHDICSLNCGSGLYCHRNL